MKDLMNFEHRWKLRSWIDIDKLNWNFITSNPNAMYLLESNPDKIDWFLLSTNSYAIHLLEENPDKINWIWLSKNPNAIHILEKNYEKIDWKMFLQIHQQCIF